MDSEEKPLGIIIDELYALRTERLSISKKVDELKAQEAVLRKSIIDRLRVNGLDSGRGNDATASITTDVQVNISDWSAFNDYVIENKSLDLLQKRVSITALKARWEDGVEVPGLTKIELPDLSLTKRRKGV